MATPPQIEGSLQKIPRRRQTIAWLLAFGILVNYFDRVNLSVAKEALHASFGISTVMFGFLSSAYAYTYAVLQVPSGLLLDRFGVKTIGRVSTFLWSVASFGASLARGVPTFFTARLVLGVGEAPTFPANAKAVGYWFPKAERSIGTSIFDGASKLGVGLGYPVLGLLLYEFGWRWCFAATGFISLIFFALFTLYYRNPSEDARLTDAERKFIARGGAQPEDKVLAARGAPIGYLLRKKKVWGMCLGYASYNYTFYFLLFWLPTFFSTALHTTPVRAALLSSIPWILATAAELFIGGLLVDKLIEHGWNGDRVRRFVLIVGTSMGLGLVGATTTSRIPVALVWITIAIGSLSAASAIGWSIPSLLAPKESVGTLGGILNTCNQLSALAVGTVTGFIVEHHSFAPAMGVAAVYLAIGIAGYIFLLGRIEQLPEPPQRAGVVSTGEPL